MVDLPLQSLEKAARQALVLHPDLRVIEFEWGGARHVLKRIEAKPRARLKQKLVRSLCRLFFPGYVLGGVLRPGDGRFEANRIRGLAEAGMRVPKVELELPEAMLYSHCGNTFKIYLRALPPDERPTIIVQAMRDLAAFHKAGYWHGGAQFRNLLVTGESGVECFCRIDFEEDFEGQFALPILQVYDLCLFLIDVLRQGGYKAEATDLGMRLVTEYHKLNWSTDHQAILRRLACIAKPICWLAPLLHWIDHSGINRVLALSLLLDKVSSSEDAYA